MNAVPSGEIKALTGLRIVAAVWVVLFHFRPLFWEAAPGFSSALSPVLDRGAQGVDLFFILSGFVLTWNYLEKMGRSWSTRATIRFLWLRLARVWPVYLVTLHLAAALVIFTIYVGHVPPESTAEFNAVSYLRQLFLVQLWFQPYFDFSSWNGPAWSISAEWLAYLLFGGLILVVFRVARATRARSLLVLAMAASLPPVVLLLASGAFYSPWSWLPRIVMQFTAGALACAAVRKLRPGDRTRYAAGAASLLLVAAVVGALYYFDAHPNPRIPDAGGLVDLLFMPLVVTLAIGAGTLPRLLSTRVMVYLGQVSFGLYMVHEIVHNAWIWASKQFELTLSGPMGIVWLLGLLAVALAVACLIYHLVEEPARHWMRRMVDVRGVASTPREAPAKDTANAGRLQNLGDHESRSESRPARAG